MGILKEIGYSYGDLTIIPTTVSNIKSRSECDPYVDRDRFLPIFTAPMSCVVDERNFILWKKNRIIPILPRTSTLGSWVDKVKFILTGEWTALGLNETKRLIQNPIQVPNYLTIRICIDVANGHMQEILDISKQLKSVYNDHIIIMAGNIANPETYSDYCYAGIDFVRVSIGSGSGCLTTSNTGVHYPIATLLDKIREKKEIMGSLATTKVIADGGIKNYSDIIKALALGADYVMVGGLFSSLLESSAIIDDFKYKLTDKPGVYEFKSDYLISQENKIEEELSEKWGKNIPPYSKEYIEHEGWQITYLIDLYESSEELKRNFLYVVFFERDALRKEFYGMSTKKAQELMGKTQLKTSEGKKSHVYVKYTISQWVENMTDYLKSAMSYCGAITLEDFIGKQTLIPNSFSELKSVNK